MTRSRSKLWYLLGLALSLGAASCGEATGPGGELGDGGSTDGGTGTDSGSDGATGSDGAAGEGGLRCVSPGFGFVPTGALRINEVMTDNEGAAVDEVGETDDFIEIVNAGSEPASLQGVRVADDGSPPAALPPLLLQPGETLLLWADDTPSQGPLHLPFRLSSLGDSVTLFDAGCEAIDFVGVPALPASESLARLPDGTGAFVPCRYATPGRSNGDACDPPPPPSLPDDVSFTPYEWPSPWPAVTGPLVITELALRPASFVELTNVGATPLDLGDYTVRVAPHGPGLPWPSVGEGALLPWPTATLAPGARLALPVSDADVQAIAGDPAFEGVATLFETATGAAVERVDFMRWPDGAVLARLPDDDGRHAFCTGATPAAPNDGCSPIASRDVGNRVRHIRTPGDFAALSSGGAALGTESVKVVVDMTSGDVVHLLGAADWALHYTFIREQVYGEPALDRCDPVQSREFDVGWGAFSQVEYFQVETRRFLLGTLVHHGAADLRTLEFALGDRISSDQMLHAFSTVMQHVEDPSAWSLRPQDAQQLGVAGALEGRAPLVGPNAPFIGMTFQPLTEAVGYGVLRFVSERALDTTPLGRDVIVVTDDVPNDIPLVGGLITEAFQTPLAHVNVLSQARQTPNMSLVGAREDPRLVPLFDKLVRLEVAGGAFSVREAAPAEAEAFWQSRQPAGPPAVPRLDPAPRGVVPLSDVGIEAIPFVGAKAAQLAELERLSRTALCGAAPAFATPPEAFAIPVAHYLDHFEQSGGRARLAELEATAEFRADPTVRAAGLAEVRALMTAEPVAPTLVAEVTEAIRTRFGAARVRLRSSSNAEDLPSFNGAGLYTSVSAAIDDPERPIERGLATVWASLWNARAYDERQLANVDHGAVAMGVLVHEAFLSERAQGVAISRNVLDPIRGDIYYVNAQIGEASVTNPAPGVVTEQLVYRLPPRLPPIIYQSRSSLTDADVLSLAEVQGIACALTAIHAHYRPLLDPLGEDRLFAMETEFKLVTDGRTLLLKQARPHPFGGADIPADCREL